MIWVTLLVAIVCAIDARHNHRSPNAFIYPPTRQSFSDPSKFPSQFEGTLPDDSDEVLENVKLPAKPLLQPFQDTYSNRSPSALQEPPKAWNAPPYKKSVLALDDGIDRLRSYFTRDTLEDKNGKRFRNIILVHVISSLAEEVANHGWDHYNRDYPHLIQKYVHEVFADPESVMRKFECNVIRPILETVEQVKRVIRSPAVQYVCNAQPSSCDAVIWGILQFNPKINPRAVELLLESGYAASAFLDIFSANFETISRENIIDYLFDVADDLRPLVAVDSLTRKLIGDHGDPNCYVSNSRPKSYRHTTESSSRYNV